jgi:hypothetical protein
MTRICLGAASGETEWYAEESPLLPNRSHHARSEVDDSGLLCDKCGIWSQSLIVRGFSQRLQNAGGPSR